MSFRNKWTKTQGERVSKKLLGGIKPHASLKLRIEEAQYELRLQISKLESISFKMQENK